jgi:hypothetical protein
MKTKPSTMRSFYFLVLLGVSNGLYQPRQSNVLDNITSTGGACIRTTTMTSTITLIKINATSSQFPLFPTSPSLRLPVPLWHNGTNSTQNFSAPTEPSVPFSATSSLRDNNQGTLMYKILFMMVVSMLSIALVL